MVLSALRAPPRPAKWDAANVELVFEPRPTGTSVVAANTRLRDAAQVVERRSQWRVALDAPNGYLAGRPGNPS